MKGNLFISHIDSSLGYHIAQFFRRDHIEVNPDTRIVGTACSPSPLPWIHATIDFKKHPNLACRAVLDCSTVVLDLRSDSHEAETIIRFLQHLKDDELKKIKIIGLSSLMTWQGLRGYQLEPDTQDKQAFFSNIIEENQWRAKKYRDVDHPKRIPGVFWNKCYQLQNMLMGLNKKKNISASVLGLGIVYGKNNEDLQSDILGALAGESLTVYGKGSNNIPLVHVEKLLQGIQKLIDHSIDYAVLSQQQSYSQKEIKDLVIRATGELSLCVSKEPLYVTQAEHFWTFQPRIQCSSIFQDITSNGNFKEYCEESLMRDLCEYTEWIPSQCVIFIEEFQPEIITEITSQVSDKAFLLLEQTIQQLNIQLITKNMPEEDELQKKKKKGEQNDLESQPPRYQEALDSLLGVKKHQSFVVICSNKLKQYLGSKYFLNGVTEIIKEQSEVEEEGGNKKIVYQSEEWFKVMNIEPEIQNVEEQHDPIPKVEENKNIYYPEKGGKKDDKLILTTQYLVDNVLGAISEAKFNMKVKGTKNISSLIDQLKTIYERGNFSPSLTKENQSLQTSKKEL